LHTVKDENSTFVVLLMISALLSRGIEEVRSDMDVATNTMIAAHGYCSQEIVTLLLTGKAHSNVFNGTMSGMMTNDDGSDMPMKGILNRSDVGHLLLTEALNPGFIEVGSNYKQPRYPIYVICSESHYSVLFSLDAAVSDPANFPGAHSHLPVLPEPNHARVRARTQRTDVWLCAFVSVVVVLSAGDVRSLLLR
jgi:hypothetical protein